MAVASVPVLLLGLWLEVTAFEREMQEVAERHLLIARNMTLALERYAIDAGAAVSMFGALVEQGSVNDGVGELGRQLGFAYFCTLHAAGMPSDHIVMDAERTVALSSAHEIMIRDLALEPGVHFSGVVLDVDGVPTIFVVLGISGGRLVLGALSTDYLRDLQGSIAFGERGHAVIVDQFGRVIGHPRADWVAEAKDLSGLAPVQAMLAGETTVMNFYSPAMDAEMVAGLTRVPATGWGVMVPQPISELQLAAAAAQTVAAVVAVTGLAVAGVLSWLLAGFLTRPIVDVTTAALRLADGDLAARARPAGRLAPVELRTLADCFNQMAAEIEDDRRDLASALDEARIADRAKSEFLANVSHELRTPLNAIIGFSELIETEPFGAIGDSRYAGYIENIRTSGEHLRDVINDILDLSAAQAVGASVAFELVDVAAVVDSALSIIASQAENAGIALASEIDPALGSIRSNARRLRQILLNLLSNAVKFTPADGTVTIQARRDEDAGALTIEVADTGIGMASEDIPVALSPFGQLEAALTRRYEGTGLGLPLAKSFAEKLGGSLAIASAKGKGTTVTLVLPLSVTDDGQTVLRAGA